ncbi:hypothetical protein D3C80_1809040 [compost metagenome]
MACLIALNKVCHHPAYAGANAKTMAAHARCHKQPVYSSNPVHHRHHIRHGVNHARPCGFQPHGFDLRKQPVETAFYRF